MMKTVKDTGIKCHTAEITCVQCLFYILLLFTMAVTAYSFIKYKDMPSIYDFYNVHSSISRLQQPYQCSYQTRMDHLKQACLQLHGRSLFDEIFINQTVQSGLKKMLADFIIDDQHKVMYCYSGKIGSTSFKHTFIYHTEKYRRRYGDRKVEVPNVHARWVQYGLRSSNHYTVEELLHRLRTYHKVITVRHPLVRVYSFFTDKIKTHKPDKCKVYQKYLAKLIISSYRNISKVDIEECPTGTRIEEFMKHMASHRFLLRDLHLRPLDHCHPCHILYDQIIKLETGDSDQRYLVERYLGGNPSGSLRMNSKTGILEDSISGQNFTTVIAEFSNTSIKDYETVKNYYLKDYILFGYNSEINAKDGLIAGCSDSRAGDCC